MISDWLAAVLREEFPAWGFGDGFDPSRILDAAQREGIVAMVHERLLDPRFAPVVPAALREGFSAAARDKAVQSLVREHQCRLILARLDLVGLPVLLLKGSALAYWAYASPYLRECGDIDLLFRSRADVDRAAVILGELHYEVRERALPGDLVCFELTCAGVCPSNEGLEIDLHWQLSSTPMFAFRFSWAELDATAVALPNLAPNARGIAPVPAYLHACMHRVQNMAVGHADALKWLYDLALLGRRFTAVNWECVTHMAIERGLAGTCLSGMEAAAARFGEVAPDSVRRTLAAAARAEVMDVSRMHRWLYIQRMNFLAFSGTRQRLRWLRQRVFPDLAYMRERYGQDGWGRSLATRLRAGIRRLRE